MVNVLILGANSFIAAHMVKLLAANNQLKLTVFSRKTETVKDEHIQYFTGDYTDSSVLSKALSGQDIVYHFISQSYPFSSWETPAAEIHQNILPFINFIELCNAANIKKIVFTSSGGTVYGVNEKSCSELTPTNPYSPHGISKLYMENLLLYAHSRYGIAYDIYRVSNAYGNGQDINTGLGFINTSLVRIVNGKSVIIYGNGDMVRDYIFVDDVCNLLALSITKKLTAGDVYNTCTGISVSLNDIIRIIKHELQIDFNVEYLDKRKSDNPTVYLDNKKLLECFPGYHFVSLEEGIKRVYASIKNSKKTIV